MSIESGEEVSSHCSVCDFEVLEALYQLNIEAKRYSESASEAYSTGYKRNARIYSQKKKALYGLKEAILEELLDQGCVDSVRTHEIEGRDYYCFYVGEFSFHTPVDEWEEQPLDAPKCASKTLDEFDSNAENKTDRLSERVALKRLSEHFESPNNYIESPFVERSISWEFVGWSYLPGAIEEGSKVSEQFKHDHTRDNFLFEVGDVFQTHEGECEIVDRYHAWLTPLWDRSPLLQREAYDVRLDGEVRESIRQQRIVDDWRIVAESIHDPLPDVAGQQAEMVGKDIETLVEGSVEFEIGDVIELEPHQEDADPCYCKIASVDVSYTLLMVDFEAVPPTDEAPLGLSVSEFADDVVAVHDESSEVE